MSNNKDFIKFLKNIQYSSVSNINLKYNKVFKEFSVDTLIERNRFENTMQKKWIIEEENKTKSKFITTNDKLKQIINSHKNIYEIQQQFFKTFDKEPLFKKLINKEHAKEKLLKKSLKAKSNKIDEKMRNILKMKEKEKEREKTDSFYKRRWEENNRKPPLGLYNPRYNYIEKHIPSFNFFNEPSVSKKPIIFKKITENKKESPKNKSRNNISVNSLNYSLTPISKIKNRSDNSSITLNVNKEHNRIKKYKEKLTPLNNKNQENVFLSQLNLPSQEKNDIDNNEKIIPFYPTPKIIEKNILVPNFKRMSERFNYNMNNQGFKSNADYNPNYNAVFSNVVDFKPVDEEKKKKQIYLKKIITNYKQIAEYVLFPELNNKSKK